MSNLAHLGIARVERETVQERVYGSLRERLMQGAFEPGQKLTIAELAVAFGTSAMPVRDAVNRLTAERALESLPNRGVRVPALSKRALRDLKEARFAVEGLAVSRAASNMTPATLTALRQLVADQEAADDDHASEIGASKNRAFHFTMYRQSGSTVLLPIIESLWLQFGPYLRDASERFDGRDGRGVNFHVQIVDALARGDGAAARAALEADIGRAFELVMIDGTLWQPRDRGRCERLPFQRASTRVSTRNSARNSARVGTSTSRHASRRTRTSTSTSTRASKRKAGEWSDAIAARGAPMSGAFELYDLRVEVVGPPDATIYCGARLGDHFELHGEMLKLPPGQGLSIYSLGALLPLLAAKQRVTDPNDWMSTDAEVACPDPHCPTRFRITRTGLRRFHHADVTAVPLPTLPAPP